MPDIDEFALTADQRSLYDVVPADGSTISNAKAQRRLRWDDDRYWPTRDQLVDLGLIARGVGRGGTLTRVLAESVEVVSVPTSGGESAKDIGVAAAAVKAREEELYEPLANVVRKDWARDHRWRPIGVEIIARQGRRATGGTWSRPDIVSVEVKNYLYLPSKILDVVTFEVKPSEAIDVTAVYEALSHRRAATHAYVLLHVPEGKAASLEGTVRIVREAAATHGVGVVVFSDPENYDTWEEVEKARRVEPDPELLNEFIDTQLPDAIKHGIAAALR